MSVRVRALSVAAAVVAVCVASIASGETPPASSARPATPPSTATPAHRKPKAPAHPKRRHAPRHPAKRPHSHTLAVSADVSPPLVDESLLPPVRAGSCPKEMSSIDGRFCIDKWEATLMELGSWGERPMAYTETLGGREARAVSVPGVFPHGYVSGVEAAAACAKSNKRLCTPMEWRKACVGPDTRLFGYGDAREKGRCNDSGKSPMLALFGGGASESPGTMWNPENMNDPRLNQLEGSLARTGAHEGCTNDYGVYDMVGNLHEWTSDPNGTFQGGYYLDTTINGDGCAYRTTAHDFGYHDYSTGFRCCEDPTDDPSAAPAPSTR